MKQTLLTTIIFLFACCAIWANVIHVTPEGVGSGTLWKDATSLQQALQAAQAGDEIWVAAGTYKPSETNDRQGVFRVPNGVKLIGGFAGDERKIEKRNPAVNISILSGEIGNPASLEDNSYTILVLENTDASTVIDGFVITAAYANGIAEGIDLSTCGAGLFINGEKANASPTILNCSFQDNFAREGAAIYMYSEAGMVTPTIRNCEFIRNRADFNGGAIFNDSGNYGTCSPSMSQCYFASNRSNYGAAVFNRGLYGTCTPQLASCIFTDNFSTSRGGVVYNSGEGRGTVEAIMIDNEIYSDNGNSVGETIDNSRHNAQPSSRSNTQPRKSSVTIRTTAY